MWFMYVWIVAVIIILLAILAAVIKDIVRKAKFFKPSHIWENLEDYSQCAIIIGVIVMIASSFAMFILKMTGNI